MSEGRVAVRSVGFIRGSRTPASAAFTLVELLVVVAILALLIATLLPSLARARDQAKAVMCGGQLKELTRATTMWLVERQAERIHGNLGWGARALRAMHGQARVFTCPSDKEPEPRPAIVLQMLTGNGNKVECTADGCFTRSRRVARGYWEVGLDDSSTEGAAGWYDADFDFNDVTFTFNAQPGQAYTRIVAQDNAGWDFALSDYTGTSAVRLSGQGVVRAPLMWGSYGINASAGGAGQAERHVVLLEAEDWSVWPESIEDMRGAWPKGALLDNLQMGNGGKEPNGSKYLRVAFRHGGVGRPYAGVYEPGERRDTCNAGFLDTHVERVKRARLLNDTNAWHPPRKKGWVRTTF